MHGFIQSSTYNSAHDIVLAMIASHKLSFSTYNSGAWFHTNYLPTILAHDLVLVTITSHKLSFSPRINLTNNP